MSPIEFEASIVGWAQRQSDIKALVQFGSRVGKPSSSDCMSDWDFHLYTSRPGKYRSTAWLTEIGHVWCANAERSLRGVVKVSATFCGGLEVDFVPLAAWQMRLVYWMMGYPQWCDRMPARLSRGITETREILLNSNYRLLVGTKSWERRLEALRIAWPEPRMNLQEVERHIDGFWQKALWVAKKIARPEPRSAQLWLHKLVGEHVYALLEEEAWLAGKRARPEALKAEQWLDVRRLEQTNLVTSLDQRILAQALRSQIDLFEDVSRSVAQSRGFKISDHSAVAAWLRAELDRIILRG